MRLVKVTAPEGAADQVAQVAFSVGISKVSTQLEQVRRPDQPAETREVVDIATSTDKAKAFIDELMAASFFDPKQYSINVRQPRSVVSSESPREVTWPVPIPTADLYEELWQFSHVTMSFVGRVVIAGLLAAYGIVENKLLFIIAGLLFTPFLPLLLAVAFGALAREWRVAAQGAFAFILGNALLAASGAAVALMLDRPPSFNESNKLLASILISVIIGIAAALSIADDAGKREMIGLAASAQLAITPVWSGIALASGHPSIASPAVSDRLVTLLLDIAAILLAALSTFIVLRIRGGAVRRFAESVGHR
jgi:hypothetical protein